MIPSTDMRTIALRPELLNAKFEVSTPWVVITGAPSSGKTSVLEQLAKQGYAWNPEIARVYIEQELARGRTIHEIRADEGQFQLGLINAKISVEANIPHDRVAFFDRAMPDSITYFRVGGLNPNDVLPNCFHFRYGSVFVFDRLPLQGDHARTEDEKTANFLDVWLERDYRALGYDVVRVPVMPIENRVQFVLKRLQSQGVV